MIDVKADDSIEPTDAEAFAAAERACRNVGWAFRRTAGPDPMLSANVRWLSGYRHARCFRSDIASALTEVFAEPAPLMTGARLTGDPLAVLPVLYHLLWKHTLAVELRNSLLGAGSIVSLGQKEPLR